MDDAIDASVSADVNAAFAKKMSQIQEEYEKMQKVQKELKGDEQLFIKSVQKMQRELETITRELGAAQVRRQKIIKELQAVDLEIVNLDKRKQETTELIYKATAESERHRADKLCSITGVPSPAAAPSGAGGLGDLFQFEGSSAAPSQAPLVTAPSVVPEVDLLGGLPTNAPPALAPAATPVGGGLDGLDAAWQQPPQQQQQQPQQQQQQMQQMHRMQQMQQMQQMQHMQNMQQTPQMMHHHMQNQMPQQMQPQMQMQMKQQMHQMQMQQQQQQHHHQQSAAATPAGAWETGSVPAQSYAGTAMPGGSIGGSCAGRPSTDAGSLGAGGAGTQQVAGVPPLADPFDMLLMGPLGR